MADTEIAAMMKAMRLAKKAEAAASAASSQPAPAIPAFTPAKSSSSVQSMPVSAPPLNPAARANQDLTGFMTQRFTKSVLHVDAGRDVNTAHTYGHMPRATTGGKAKRDELTADERKKLMALRPLLQKMTKGHMQLEAEKGNWHPISRNVEHACQLLDVIADQASAEHVDAGLRNEVRTTLAAVHNAEDAPAFFQQHPDALVRMAACMTKAQHTLKLIDKSDLRVKKEAVW